MKNEGYPKFLYHPKEGKRLLHTEEEEKKLGKGWVDSPAGFKESKKEEKEETKENLSKAKAK